MSRDTVSGSEIIENETRPEYEEKDEEDDDEGVVDGKNEKPVIRSAFVPLGQFFTSSPSRVVRRELSHLKHPDVPLPAMLYCIIKIPLLTRLYFIRKRNYYFIFVIWRNRMFDENINHIDETTLIISYYVYVHVGTYAVVSRSS